MQVPRARRGRNLHLPVWNRARHAHRTGPPAVKAPTQVVFVCSVAPPGVSGRREKQKAGVGGPRHGSMVAEVPGRQGATSTPTGMSPTPVLSVQAEVASDPWLCPHPGRRREGGLRPRTGVKGRSACPMTPWRRYKQAEAGGGRRSPSWEAPRWNHGLSGLGVATCPAAGP